MAGTKGIESKKIAFDVIGQIVTSKKTWEKGETIELESQSQIDYLKGKRLIKEKTK